MQCSHTCAYVMFFWLCFAPLLFPPAVVVPIRHDGSSNLKGAKNQRRKRCWGMQIVGQPLRSRSPPRPRSVARPAILMKRAHCPRAYFCVRSSKNASGTANCSQRMFQARSKQKRGGCCDLRSYEGSTYSTEKTKKKKQR